MVNNESERWAPARANGIDYSGLYAVSDLGRVRRELSRTRAKAGDFLKLVATRDGYLCVSLSRPGTRERCVRVHRLVFESFSGEIPRDLVVNHLDGDKSNNKRSNLALATSSENIRHAFGSLGRKAAGAKVTDSAVIAIRTRRAAGESLTSLAASFGVTPAAISSIAKGRTWKHAGGPLTAPRTMRAKPQDVVRRISSEAVAGFLARHKAGESVRQLAIEADVSQRTVRNWIGGRTR